MNKWVGLAIVAIVIFFGFALMRNINEQTEPVTDTSEAGSPIGHWHKFTSPESNFSVMFPNPPHHANEIKNDNKELGRTNYDVYISTKEDGPLFSVYVISFPEKKLGNKKDFLSDFIKKTLSSNPTNEIKNFQALPGKNGNAVEFTVENDGSTVYGRAFINDNTIYIVSTTAKNEAKNKAEYDLFIDSFTMIPEKKK